MNTRWAWKSFFRAFLLTFLILCLSCACGMGIQYVFETAAPAYGLNDGILP